MTRLQRLARHHGLATRYDDGPVPQTTLETVLTGLGVDPEGAPRGGGAPTRMSVPRDARCHLPAWLTARPAWGVFCQLYELRSDRNWGIGDFADLARLAEICGAEGADFLGVNPLHALFTAQPDHASPFSPSNRSFLNPLYIAPDALGCPEPAALDRLRTADHVDYPAVTAAKLPALRAAFDAFAGDAAFDAFVAEGGEALRRHAIFETISHLQVAAGGGHGWRAWPPALQDVAGPEVAALAQDHADDVRFHMWLQWVARRQLADAQAAARAAGMRLGLYLDLAVGEAPDGSATWSDPDLSLPGVTVGAPPDMFSQTGQGWGLAAPSPRTLRRRDMAPFRRMIRAQLRDAGALRIDHAMALWQLFVIPDGAPPADGTHLRYPLAEMLRALAIESRKAGAVVIGEDLGWVPDGFRAAMNRANVLSYRIAFFEQDGSGFRPASSYPHHALACLSTHDLPTLPAWWRADDVARRAAHGLVSSEDSAAHLAHRATERGWLLRAIGLEGDATADDPPDGLTVAAHAFVARTPCLLAAMRLADVAGPVAPTNLPGVTEDAYPNWRPRAPLPLEALAGDPAFRANCAAFREARPR